VKALVLEKCEGGTLFHTTWDGRNYADRIVTSNVYVIVMRQTATTSSRHRRKWWPCVRCFCSRADPPDYFARAGP